MPIHAHLPLRRCCGQSHAHTRMRMYVCMLTHSSLSRRTFVRHRRRLHPHRIPHRHIVKEEQTMTRCSIASPGPNDLTVLLASHLPAHQIRINLGWQRRLFNWSPITPPKLLLTWIKTTKRKTESHIQSGIQTTH